MHKRVQTYLTDSSHDTKTRSRLAAPAVLYGSPRQQPAADIEPRRDIKQRHTFAGSGQTRIHLGRKLRRPEYVGRRADAALPERLGRRDSAVRKSHRGDRRHHGLALLDPHQLRTGPLRPRQQAGRTPCGLPRNVQNRDTAQRRGARRHAGQQIQLLRPSGAPVQLRTAHVRHRLRRHPRHAAGRRRRPVGILPQRNLPHTGRIPGQKQRPDRHRTARTVPHGLESRIRVRRKRQRLLHRRKSHILRIRHPGAPPDLQQGHERRDGTHGQRVEHRPRRRRLHRLILYQRRHTAAHHARTEREIRHRAHQHPLRRLFAAARRPAGDRMDRHRRTGTLPAYAQRHGVPLDHLQPTALQPLETRPRALHRRRADALGRNQRRRHPAHRRLLRPQGVHPGACATAHDRQQRAARQFGLRLCPQQTQPALDRHRRRRTELLFVRRPAHPHAPHPGAAQIHTRPVRDFARHAVGGHGGLRRIPRDAGRHGVAALDTRGRATAFQRRTGDQELLLHALPRKRFGDVVRQPRRRRGPLRHRRRRQRSLQVRRGAQRHRQRHLRHPPQRRRHHVVRLQRRADRIPAGFDLARSGHPQHRARHSRRPQGRPLAEHQPRSGAVLAPHGLRGDLRLFVRTEHHRIQRRGLFRRPADGHPLLRRHRRTGDHRGYGLPRAGVQSPDAVPRHPAQRRHPQHRRHALPRRRADAQTRTAHLRDHGLGARLRERQQLQLLQPSGRLQRPVGRRVVATLVRRPAGRHLPARRALPQQHHRGRKSGLFAADTSQTGVVCDRGGQMSLRTVAAGRSRGRHPPLPAPLPTPSRREAAAARNPPQGGGL